MSTQSILYLYQAYSEAREIDLNVEQFTLFVEFFPAILVITSDGVFDQSEEEHLGRLVQSLANSFAEEGFNERKVEALKNTFIREYHYLIDNIELWQEKYLQALGNHLAHYPESKSVVLNAMQIFARASEAKGNAEQETIFQISQILAL